MVQVPPSDKPPPVIPPVVDPAPETRHCWRHVSPNQGNQGDPVFLLAWARGPDRRWWGQILRMTGHGAWVIEWVTADLLSLDRYARGNPPPGGRRGPHG